MKSKRQIYAEILHHGITFIRNRSEEATTCHVIADFLHNIPLCMLNTDFEDNDFYFLNLEVPGYVAYCQHLQVLTDPTLLALTDELRGIVPDELKFMLKDSAY